MKILLIGDFHGKFTNKLIKQIEKEKPNLILCTGDFCGSKRYSKLFFKYLYGEKEEEVPPKILNKLKKIKQNLPLGGKKVLKKLKELNINIYSVRGNWDPIDYLFDIGGDKLEEDERKKAKDFLTLENKKLRFIDFKFIELPKFIVIGGASSTSPGIIHKKKLKKYYTKEELAMREKEYKRREKIYIKNFEKAKKKNKPIIFLTHNCPYYKLDKLKRGPNKGKHYGSYLEKKIIKKYQPSVVVCGHIHENRGKIRFKRSLIVNPGAALENRFAILDFNEKTNKFKVKFFN